MFSLIISIIAIALVAALAGASVYYGGSAFNKGTAGADASTLVNGGQQINGAVALAKNDGVDVSDLTNLGTILVPNYLTQLPSYNGTDFSGDTSSYVSVSGADIITADVCKEVQKRAGDDVSAVGYTLPTTSTGGLYGCYGDPTNSTAPVPYTFEFKVK